MILAQILILDSEVILSPYPGPTCIWKNWSFTKSTGSLGITQRLTGYSKFLSWSWPLILLTSFLGWYFLFRQTLLLCVCVSCNLFSSGEIWQDLLRSVKIVQNLWKSFTICQDLLKYVKIWRDLTRSNGICQNPSRSV